MAHTAEHPLVGRATELGMVDRVLAELERGTPAALAIAGEPGIGKTRLLAELTSRADSRGRLVLAGSASEFEHDVAFRLFVDALDAHVAELEPRRLDALDAAVRAELARVLPSLAGFAAGRGPALPDERHRIHHAIRELLTLLGTGRPLVLVLDDVHWADSGSAELLGALLRRPPAAPVLLALAARPRQLPERLTAALERARRAGTIARADLGALSRVEAAQLLGDAIAGDVYEASGGNPFYLEQLARAGGAVRAGPAARSGDGVPPVVAAALAGELALLPAPARRVLEGAAVAGDPFEPDLAAAAAGAAEPDAMAALDQLLGRDLVRHTEVPRRFRFRHPLVRRAVYDAAPGGWRLGAHERCAEALAARGASAAERAHHVERSARHGDLAAVAVLREAGEATMAQAPASAARMLAAALRLLGAGSAPGERIGLLTALAGAHAATGRLREARDAMLGCIVLLDGEPALRVRLTASCARIEHALGHHEAAHSHLVAALEELPEAASPEAVVLMIELAFDGLFRGDYAAMHGWGIRALAAARPLGVPALVASAAGTLATSAALAGAIPEARARLAEATAALDGLRDDELGRFLDTAAGVAAAELSLDRFDAARAHAARALRVGRATGQGHIFPLVYPIVGTVRWMRGELGSAAELYDGAIEAMRLAGNADGLAWNLFGRSMAATAAGDVQTALATAEESVELLAGERGTFPAAMGGMALAAARLAAGEPARARDVLLATCGGPELRFLPGGWRVSGLEVETRCLLALGRRAEAAGVAARALATAGGLGLPLAASRAERAAAAVALAGGDAEGAASRALASAAAADAVGAVIDGAAARVLAGRALAAFGDADGAAAQLARAAAELDACGALRPRDEAERELRRLGRRLHPRTHAG